MVDLEAIARQALAEYDIRSVACRPIAQSGGAVFKVEDMDSQSYSLRIHVPKSTTLEPDWFRRDVLESELVWLDALCRDTGLVLPQPRRNRAGAYVTTIDGINGTLLTWVEGEQRPYFTSEQDLRSTAEMTAALHHQASGWQPPAGFTRPLHDGARVRLALDLLAQAEQAGRLDASDVRTLVRAGEKAAALLDSLPRNPGNWGVLHMDLLPANIVYVDGRANPIDFGACGYGFFLGDLAATFCFVPPPARQAYLDWYGACYPLPEGHVERLEALFVATCLTSMIHFLGLPDADGWLLEHIRKLAEREFGSYVRGEGFLFAGKPFWE